MTLDFPQAIPPVSAILRVVIVLDFSNIMLLAIDIIAKYIDNTRSYEITALVSFFWLCSSAG